MDKHAPKEEMIKDLENILAKIDADIGRNATPS